MHNRLTHAKEGKNVQKHLRQFIFIFFDQRVSITFSWIQFDKVIKRYSWYLVQSRCCAHTRRA